MDLPLPKPDQDRLSSMTALILLTYGLVRVIQLPSLEWEFSFLGLLIRLEFETRTFMVLLAGALSFAGADWLVRSHPRAQELTPGVEHRVVPGFAALGAGAILTRVPAGAPLAAGLVAAGILLAAIFWAEFVVFDASDPRRDWASLGLRTLSFLLLVGAFVIIRISGLRAAFAVPLVFLSSAAIAWRWLKLERHVGIEAVLAPTIGWVVAQIAWGLHYWPLSPVRGALILGATSYLSLGLAWGHLAARWDRNMLLELGLVALGSVAVLLVAT